METASRLRNRNTNIALWVTQVVLASLFAFAGGFKLLMPLESLKGPVVLPGLLLRFIGAVEVLGAIGLIFPALLRVHPALTPLAAAGLVIIMAGAVTLTTIGVGFGAAIFPMVVGLLAAFVAYGRWRLVPRARVQAS